MNGERTPLVSGDRRSAGDGDPFRAPAGRRTSVAGRGLLLAGLILLAAVVIWALGDAGTLDGLAAREAELRDFAARRPVATYSAALLLYVVVTGLALPVATGLSLAYGWVFGFWRSLVLVSFASTGGATLSFLASRYLLGDWLQRRYGARLTAINAAVEREGAWYLFTLRLIPYVPYFLINVALGLSRMRVGTFWWVSQVGMLPGTCVYLWAASSVKSLGDLRRDGVASILTPQLAIALTVLGVMPLGMRWAGRRFWGRRGVQPSELEPRAGGHATRNVNEER